MIGLLIGLIVVAWLVAVVPRAVEVAIILALCLGELAILGAVAWWVLVVGVAR